MDALVVTETASMDVKLRTALPGLDVRVVGTLGDAARELRIGSPRAIIVDLRWSLSWSVSLTNWLMRNVLGRRIQIVLSAETPLARDLRFARCLGEAVFLAREFDLWDLAEAVGLAAPLPADMAA